MQTHAIDMDALGRGPALPLENAELALKVDRLNLFYGGDKQALFDISLDIPKQRVTAFIGPSGCGKSSLLRCFNRMNDLVDGSRVDGSIMLEGDDIYDRRVDVSSLRRRIGMVFQKPNPFPKSIYENVAYGLRIQGLNKKRILDEVVERSLKAAALWDEVKDRLNDSALGLSGGQQQRLVIARTIAVEPEVVLLDEPASGLSVEETQDMAFWIEDMQKDLGITILMVEHDMSLVNQVSNRVLAIADGRPLALGTPQEVQSHPAVIEAYLGVEDGEESAA